MASKANRKQKRQELDEIPTGLDNEFLSLVTGLNQWHQMRVQRSGYDFLSMASIKEDNKAFRLQWDALKKTSERTGQSIVMVLKTYALGQASYFPINTTFRGGKQFDPTKNTVLKLDVNNDSGGLLATGIEYLIIPAYKWKEKGQAFLEDLETNSSKEQGNISRAMSSSPKAGGSVNARAAAKARRQKGEFAKKIELIEEKVQEWGDGFMVFPRVWAFGLKNVALERVRQLDNELRRYKLEQGNSFVQTGQYVEEDFTKLPSLARTTHPLVMAHQDEPSVLTSTELAALWHLPNVDFEVSGLKKSGAQSPPPSQALVWKETLPDGQIIVHNPEWRREYGRVYKRDGTTQHIGLNEKSILKATACTGRPGSGKSVNIESFALQDMERNDRANKGKGGSPFRHNSVIISDPNGDLIYDTIDRMPDRHELLTCLVDPLDEERMVSLNPLGIPNIKNAEQGQHFARLIDTLGGDLRYTQNDGDDQGYTGGSPSGRFSQSEGRSLADKGQPLTLSDGDILRSLMQENRKYGIEGLIAASVQELFAKSMGVSMDRTPTIFRVLQNTIFLLLGATTQGTFKSMYRIITNPGYRQACLNSLSYLPEISQVFWADEFGQLEKDGKPLMPTKSRLEGLLRSDPIALLLGQPRSTINLRESIDKGMNIFFRFSPELGDNKPFMMVAVFNLIKQAVFSRVDIPKEQRRLLSVYLDEFQEMVGADSSTLQIWLEQARKFGGAVFLGHQNLDQVRALLSAIKGTVANQMPMSVGAEDREYYAKSFDSAAYPYEQLLNTFRNLPAYAAIAQLQYNNQDYTPVLLNSLERRNRAPSLIPALIARDAPVSEQVPAGYELIHLEDERGKPFRSMLQVSEKEGFEGFWETNAKGRRKGVRAVNPFTCKGLIEELTRFLYERRDLTWAIDPRIDPQGFTEAGLEVSRFRNDPSEVKRAQRLLIDVEKLDSLARQKKFEAMNEADWQLYRASRLSRDKKLYRYLSEHPNLISEKRSRVITFSRLSYGVPVPEAKAEANRPDKFLRMVARGEVDFGDGGDDAGGDAIAV